MRSHRSASSTSPGGGRGFTLIELMITVAIIAVLAMVAMPAYFDSVRKSRRADAITVLNQISQAQERWRANCPNYITATASMAVAPGAACTGGLGASAASTYYTFTLAGVAGASSAVAYAATATAIGSQVKDTLCTSLTLAASGGQFSYTATPTANSARCWSR